MAATWVPSEARSLNAASQIGHTNSGLLKCTALTCLMSEHFLLKALSSHRQQAKGSSGLPLVAVMLVVLEVVVGVVGVWSAATITQ